MPTIDETRALALATLEHAAGSRPAFIELRTAAPTLARALLDILDAPLTLAGALRSAEFAAGTHAAEWDWGNGVLYSARDDNGEVNLWEWNPAETDPGEPVRWEWGRFAFGPEDFRSPARLVPIAEADADPATRGPIGGV